MRPLFVTTSIAYPNGAPHIGYALELLQADAIVRALRMQGRQVYSLTGVDEHGLKIQRAAEAKQVTPQDLVDEMSGVFASLVGQLNIANDRFIRTSDADHVLMAQALWQVCAAKGDIEKRQYQAWYNVKEEEFMGLVSEFPDPSVFGVDPKFIEKIDEVNYFFLLSRYSDRIRQLIETDMYKIVPASRKQEVLNVIDQHGLQDISISREASKLSWGIPVPGDDTQVMYVWFDALTNYLTASCSLDEEGAIVTGDFWPASLHCVGKDIIRFHALIWPGMLLSAGLPLPLELLVHGHLTNEGKKMSKSLGNVADPFAVIEKYGVDAVRWFLLKEVGTTADGDFSEDRLRQVYQADLANTYGNLVSRVWMMVQKYSGGLIPNRHEDYVFSAAEAWKQYDEALSARNLHSAFTIGLGILEQANRLIDSEKPWELAKAGENAKVEGILYQLLEMIRQATLMLTPAIPGTAAKVQEALFSSLPECSFDDACKVGRLEEGGMLGVEQPMLFPRLV